MNKKIVFILSIIAISVLGGYYVWAVSPPGSVDPATGVVDSITGAAETTYTAPSVDFDTTYTCTLTITDDKGSRGFDDVDILVLSDSAPPTVDIRIFDSGDNDVTETKTWLKDDNYTVKFKAIDNKSGLDYYEYYIYQCEAGGTLCDEANPIDHTTGNYNGEIGTEVTKEHLMEAGKSPKKYNLEGSGTYKIHFLATDKVDQTADQYRWLSFDFSPPTIEIR